MAITEARYELLYDHVPTENTIATRSFTEALRTLIDSHPNDRLRLNADRLLKAHSLTIDSHD